MAMHLGLGECIMLAWHDSLVTDSDDSESDESAFEEDEELTGETDDSDRDESDDEEVGENEYAEYEDSWTTTTGVPAIRGVPIGTGRASLSRPLAGTPRVSTLDTQPGPVAQVVRAHA